MLQEYRSASDKHNTAFLQLPKGGVTSQLIEKTNSYETLPTSTDYTAQKH